MFLISSSTLIQEVLRSRFRRRRECMGIYSTVQEIHSIVTYQGDQVYNKCVKLGPQRRKQGFQIIRHILCCDPVYLVESLTGRGNHQVGRSHILPYRRRNELHSTVGICKHSAYMLVMSMSPTYSSTLIHEVLRSRDRWRRKFMGIYFSTKSMSTHLSLSL